MKATTRGAARIALVMVVAAALLAATPASVMAATTTTLAGDGTDSISSWNAGENNLLEYTLSASNTDFGTDGTTKVLLNATHDGNEHFSTSTTDIASGDASYTFSFNESELDSVPGEPLETTTITVNAWGEDSNGNVQTTMDTFQVDLVFSDQRSVMYINDTSNAPVDVETQEAGTLSSLAFWSESEDTDVVSIDSERAIEGDATDIHVFMDDSDVSTPFSDAAEDYSSSEDAVLSQTVMLDDEPVPVFNSAADTNIVSDPANETHAVYDSGDDRVTIELGDKYASDQAADTYVASHDPMDDAVNLGFEDVESAYNEELSMDTLRDQFSLLEVGILNRLGLA